MAWISPLLTVNDIIRQAALALKELDVAQGKNDRRREQYFDAMNKFMQSFGMAKNWWFLTRESAFGTKEWKKTYDMRLQASCTVTITGAASGAVIVDGTSYTFTSAATTQALAIADLIALINAGTQCYAIQTSATEVELYWAGDDGIGKVVSDTSSNVTTDLIFAVSMADFSRLNGIKLHNLFRLQRVNPISVLETAVTEVNGQPLGYSMTQGQAVMRLYGSAYGGPDGLYGLLVNYQAMPSAILPDGTGQIDIPVEFHDILPQALKVILMSNDYDEAAVFGDQYIQRRLAELERFNPDNRAIQQDSDELSLPRMAINLDIRDS